MYLIKEPPETLFPWGVWFFRHEEASKCQQFSQEPRWFSCSDKCGTLAALALEASEWHLAGSHGPGQVQISHSYNLFKITDTHSVGLIILVSCFAVHEVHPFWSSLLILQESRESLFPLGRGGQGGSRAKFTRQALEAARAAKPALFPPHKLPPLACKTSVGALEPDFRWLPFLNLLAAAGLQLSSGRCLQLTRGGGEIGVCN